MTTEVSFKNYNNSDRESRRRMKAVYSGAVTLLGGLITAFADNGITVVEGLTVASAVVISVGGVYGFKAARA